MAGKLLVFGAGNIGRSFVGQLFSRAGWEVVFADVDDRLIGALNARHGYTVEIRDRQNASLEIGNVRAVRSTDDKAVIREMTEADCCATAVGPAVLPKLYPVMALGLAARKKAGKGPLDIILCENLRNAGRLTRQALKKLLPEGFPLDQYAGLVETSIGKMVPIVTEKQRQSDPLTVYAEAYNTLILDKNGFINPAPDVPGLSPKENMKAYVDRKSFVHNLGHAALAYFARRNCPGMVFTYEAVEEADLREWTRAAMLEAGTLLLSMYPHEFTPEDMEAHIEDLLSRFGNRSLHDTLHRVGRDLNRKLSKEDRLSAPLLLCRSHGLPFAWILTALVCGLCFDAPDEAGRLLPADAELLARIRKDGPQGVLMELCGLSGPLLEIAVAAYASPAGGGDVPSIKAFVDKETAHAFKNP